MTIIDLLVKIAKGEELPKKIKYNGILYELEAYDDWSYYIDRDTLLTLLEKINSVMNLNAEIEIIEEDKKIEKIDYYDHLGVDLSQAVCNKINEIIDKLNGGKDD